MISTVSLAVRWLLGWFLAGRVRPLPHTDPSVVALDPPRRVSIIVPARDEARLLPRLLASLHDQTLPPFEVIVVDDDSSDETPALARRAGAIVVESPGPPSGWMGKTYACWLGAARAQGDLLVFLDADTVCAPDLVARVAGAHAHRGGIVTVQPYHRMERAYERASGIFHLVALAGIGARSLRRRARITGAFGPCIAIGRDDYFRIGGHESVRASVLEDVALARHAAGEGVRVHAFESAGAITFRMYPDGPGHLFDGWSKNFAAGAGSTPPARLAGIVAWISGLIEAGWWSVAALVPGADVSATHIAFFVLFAAQVTVMLRPTGNFGASGLLFPLGVAVFFAVFVRSLWWMARGRVRWKGRVIATRGAAP